MGVMSDQATSGVVGRMFPILGANAFVPWDFVQPHERWALNNHDQTVRRLADRGGLSWCELCAVIEHRRWQAMDVNSAHPTKAVARVLGHLIAWYDARLASPSNVSSTDSDSGTAPVTSDDEPTAPSGLSRVPNPLTSEPQ